MNKAIIGVGISIAAIAALASCASQQYAGVSEYGVKSFKDENKQTQYEFYARNGKELAHVDATLIKNADGSIAFKITEDGVTAFRGQEISANAATGAVSTAAKSTAAIMIAPIALPAIGAVAGGLAATGGLGAAAVGAAGGVVADKLLTPPPAPPAAPKN